MMGLEALAIGAIAGGLIYGGISASQQGKSEQELAEYNASLERQRAREIESATRFKQLRQAEAGARELSAMQAGAGASGAVTTRDAPVIAQAKQEAELELENIGIGREGLIKAGQARSRAAMYKAQGKLAKRRGINEMIGSFAGAGGTLLGGFAEAKKDEGGWKNPAFKVPR